MALAAASQARAIQLGVRGNSEDIPGLLILHLTISDTIRNGTLAFWQQIDPISVWYLCRQVFPNLLISFFETDQTFFASYDAHESN